MGKHYSIWVAAVRLPAIDVDSLKPDLLGPGLNGTLQQTESALNSMVDKVPEYQGSDVVSHSVLRIGDNLVTVFLFRHPQ